jgi:hypothetical protein
MKRFSVVTVLTAVVVAGSWLAVQLTAAPPQDSARESTDADDAVTAQTPTTGVVVTSPAVVARPVPSDPLVAVMQVPSAQAGPAPMPQGYSYSFAPGQRGAAYTWQAGAPSPFVVAGRGLGLSQEVVSAIQELKQAESDEDRSAAEDKLLEALDAEYDKHLAAYEESLDKLEKRLSELRDEVEKRRDAKEELVQLRLRVLINEANGLGWPGMGGPMDVQTFNFSWGVEGAPGQMFGLPGVDAVSPPDTPRAPRAGGRGDR